MKSKLIILGSGSSIGVPRIDGDWGKCDRKNKKNIRSRCSAIIIKGSNHILIDTSPDIKSQLLQNKVKDITSVIYTHEHADQTNGLFELMIERSFESLMYADFSNIYTTEFVLPCFALNVLKNIFSFDDPRVNFSLIKLDLTIGG